MVTILETVRNRKNHEANPFILGKTGIANYFNNLQKQIEYEIEKQKSHL
ncbi:hypothetical protein [Clostridium sp.]